MKSSFKRLGDYIQLVDNRNKDLEVTLLRGVSTKKKLIKSVANMIGVSLHKYKIVEPNQFVYVADTSRRGEKIALALNNSETCIVSSIYTTFKIKYKNKLLPEYLFIWFNRSEFDRYARFNSWGSARETFDWEDMCDLRLPIPDDIEIQKKYVALYKGLLNNQKVYENSLKDLQLICDTYIENLIKTEEPKLLGDFIQQVIYRNDLNKKLPVQGVSNSRKFIETRAKTQGINFTNYKIVKKSQFVYNPSRLNIGSIALRNEDDCIVSPMYVIFEIKDIKKILPEFLFLWFKREAFCHYVWFYAFGSVRDTFDYSLMEEVKLPIPDIKIQEAIVTIYHTLETRKRINEQLKENIKPLCPVLMKGVVEEMNI